MLFMMFLSVFLAGVQTRLEICPWHPSGGSEPCDRQGNAAEEEKHGFKRDTWAETTNSPGRGGGAWGRALFY